MPAECEEELTLLVTLRWDCDMYGKVKLHILIF